ncbi:hypothetical protein FE257_009317 [Aspergillus nanangensis]|uniref:Major facilitator superfamily (MFS) profile domain-containing protein n=1 Tax=Aspergillus nanangensis TaxID=2582783 RepID=A0AAD4CKP1_ASPNN|nr:hypothetical protein FE257_009317 [Aspergillus nanangensis]
MTSLPDLEHIIKPWQPPPQKSYILTNANVIDPVAGTVLENATVKLSNGLILSVDTPHAAEQPPSDTPPNTTHLDLQGKYLCPGLIDSHVHVAAVPGSASLREMKDLSSDLSLLRQPHVCQSMLDRGFTTVRDCGGASLALKDSIADGVIRGPRLFIAGHALSQTGGHGDRRQPHDPNECCAGHVNGIGRIVDGVAQCLKYAREEIRQGSDFIKIMGGGGVASPSDQIHHLQFSDEEIRAIVTVAENVGTYVTSHAYTPRAIQQAVDQGVKGIEHGNLLDEETARLMKEKGVFLTPTLVTYATMDSPEFRGFLPPASAAKNREVLDQGLRALKLAADVGVDVCFGTDLLGPLHFAQSREFAIRSAVQTPLEILRSATITPARMLRQAEFLGQIAPGFAADLLVLNANPLEDITVLDRFTVHVLASIKDGRVVVPVIPTALHDRGVIKGHDDDQRWVSTLDAILSASTLVVSPVAGYCIDRIDSRRWPFMSGLILLTGGTAVLCIGTHLALWICGRMLQGAACAVVWVMGSVMLRETVDGERLGQAFGYLDMAQTGGIIAGPLLGGVLYEDAGYYAVFGLAFALLGLDMGGRLLVIEKKKDTTKWLLPGHPESTTDDSSAAESQTRERERGPKKNVVWALLSSPRLWVVLWSYMVNAVILASFDSVLPIFVRDHIDWKPSAQGLVFLPLGIPQVFSPAVGTIRDRYPRTGRYMVGGAFLVGCPAFVLLRFVADNSIGAKVLLCVLLAILGFCVAWSGTPLFVEMSDVVCAVEQLAAPIGKSSADVTALAFGLLSCADSLGDLAGPFLVGFVKIAAGWATMAWVLGLLVGVSGVLAILFIGRHGPKSLREELPLCFTHPFFGASTALGTQRGGIILPSGIPVGFVRQYSAQRHGLGMDLFGGAKHTVGILFQCHPSGLNQSLI